jgi:phosphopantothenoylcysteine decarboxylase/phosphopantothenate--cysteine ligase
MSDKRVLLIVGGGIAAYKSLELVRLLAKSNIATTAILTQAGAQFVTPLSLAALTGNKVYQDLFSLTDESEMGHIELSRSADLIVVAPATADLMAKAAHGFASDLATTTLLATDTPVLMAPAMNVRMWMHPATQVNFTTLKSDGVTFIGPNDGDMACGEYGPGRMAEPGEIAAAIRKLLIGQEADRPLTGKTALVTSGPTHEPIDPVRYIANRSSGKQGHAIAAALAALGAKVTLVSGPVAIPAPQGVTYKQVETARDMLAACEASLPADIAVCAAAVADWRVAEEGEEKIKKDGKAVAPLNLIENPDILATLSRHPFRRPALVVGFAAETENVVQHARAKRIKKGCDWIVANDVSPETGVMGGDENTVLLVNETGEESWPKLAKTEVALRLAQRIAAHFKQD